MNLDIDSIQHIASYCYPREMGILLFQNKQWKREHFSERDANRNSLNKLFLLNQLRHTVKKNRQIACRSQLIIDKERYRCLKKPDHDSLFCRHCGFILLCH